MDWGLALAGLGIGVIVGLTGMGGGALMTPVLVLFFGISPLTAEITELSADISLLHTALNISTVDALISTLFSALLNSSSVIDALSARLNLSKEAGKWHTSTNTLEKTNAKNALQLVTHMRTCIFV